MIRLLNLISTTTGFLVWLPLPAPLSGWSIKIFCSIFSIDTTTAEKDLSEYRSIGEFFSRRLKPDTRQIESACVSPVDGKLRDYGRVSSNWLPQVKGKRYSLSEFLGSEKDASRYQGGTYFHFYLSPKDYHRIHFPVSGNVTKWTHFPGSLFPVNEWSWSSIENLFVKNERIVACIDSPHGLVTMVLIGALNVGGMEILTDREHHTAGDEYAMFLMGSAVVLLFENDHVKLEDFSSGLIGDILMGKNLLKNKN